MSEKLAKFIFWGGTLSSLGLFLALTWDTHRQFDVLTHADRLDAQVVAGKRVFEKYNCNDCHTILGFGGYYAPDLTRAYPRLGEDAIARRLEQPEVAFADSFRKMPKQNLSPQEVADLVAYLKWVSEIENQDWPPQDSAKRWKRSTESLLAGATLSPGAALVKQENCLACHTLGDMGEKKGPRLEWIGARRTADWIATYLQDPQKVSPGANMPDYAHLSPEQRMVLAQFVVSQAAAGGR